jgi:hypothetical protein
MMGNLGTETHLLAHTHDGKLRDRISSMEIANGSGQAARGSGRMRSGNESRMQQADGNKDETREENRAETGSIVTGTMNKNNLIRLRPAHREYPTPP